MYSVKVHFRKIHRYLVFDGLAAASECIDLLKECKDLKLLEFYLNACEIHRDSKGQLLNPRSIETSLFLSKMEN